MRGSKGGNSLALLNLGFQMMWDSLLWYSIGMFFVVWVRIAIGGTIAIGSMSIRIDIGVRVVPSLSSSPLSLIIGRGMGESVSFVVLSLLIVLSISPLSPSAASALTFLLRERSTALLALLLPVLLVLGVLPRGPGPILLAIVLIRTPVLLRAMLGILAPAFPPLAPGALWLWLGRIGGLG